MSEVVYRAAGYEPVHVAKLHVLDRIPAARGRSASFLALAPVVTWYRSAIYRVVAVHGGRELACLATYGDVLGLLDGLQDAITRARAEADAFDVRTDSSLQMRVHLSMQDEPLLMDDGPARSGGRRGERTPRDWFYLPHELMPEEAVRRLADPVQGPRLFRGLQRIVPLSLGEEEVVWSTADTDADRLQHQALVDRLRALRFKLPPSYRVEPEDA